MFAKEVVRELNSEDEEGTTAIHKMFDAAFIEAIEQGAEGVEECSADEEDGSEASGRWAAHTMNRRERERE